MSNEYPAEYNEDDASYVATRRCVDCDAAIEGEDEFGHWTQRCVCQLAAEREDSDYDTWRDAVAEAE